MLRASGIGSAYVVTHGWHMPRALLAFRAAGFPVVPAPTNPERNPDPGLSAFLPSAAAWGQTYYAAHEWLGIMVYHLRLMRRGQGFEGAPTPPMPQGAEVVARAS
jgi:uncharacterized SAM-binding protein YcdF (DUF218 family)